MKITPLTIFLAFFSAGAATYLVLRLRQAAIGYRTALIWIFLWLSIGIFSIFPDLLDLIIGYLQMDERINFVLLSAVFVLLLFVFDLNMRLYQMQHNWQKVVREKAVFLVGSPRSGTTILENMLSCHDKVMDLYEPYFLWENCFDVDDDDIWDANQLTPAISRKIQREFATFARKSNTHLVLDKLPTHSFNIPTIHKIFPEARWIHIVRDGRDVTLSIAREWEKRKSMVQKKDFKALLKTALTMLNRQPFWRFKIMAVTHELKKNFSLNPSRYLNKARWKGQIGWGPRFEGWKKFLDTHTSLEFNAMQWVQCVKSIRSSWDLLPEENKLEIRYEDLLADPRQTLQKILIFLGYQPDEHFFNRLPPLKLNNVNKWTSGFTETEIEAIKPILTPMLEETGYLRSRLWE